jgi:hypothetical protein
MSCEFTDRHSRCMSTKSTHPIRKVLFLASKLPILGPNKWYQIRESLSKGTLNPLKKVYCNDH